MFVAAGHSPLPKVCTSILSLLFLVNLILFFFFLPPLLSSFFFVSCSAIESANILKGKATSSINLSPQQIVDCDHDFVFGCNGGRPGAAYGYSIALVPLPPLLVSSSLPHPTSRSPILTSYLLVIKVGGQEGIADYPYTAHDGTCKFNSTDIQLSISTYQSVSSFIIFSVLCYYHVFFLQPLTYY